MAKLVGQPDWQFFDAQGAVLASGTLTFYSPGTTTLKNIYDDTDEAVTLTNPVTLDAAGRVPAPIFGTGSYDVLVKDSGGNTLESISNWGEPESTAEPENVNTISKTSSYTLQAADLANQLTVRIDISSASVAITELALGNMSGTVRYVVVGDDGAGATYSAQVKNSAGTEVWTGYRVGDFFECTYDGTNRTISSEYTTVYGKVVKTADESVAAATTVDPFDSDITVSIDVGGWHDGTDGPVAAFAALMEFTIYQYASSNVRNFQCTIANGGTHVIDIANATTGSTPNQIMPPYYKFLVEAAASDAFDVAAKNADIDTAVDFQGDAAGDESFFTWRVIKRIR